MAGTVAEPLTDLSGITEFHWGTAENLGDTALEIRFDFGFGNDCRITAAASRQGERSSFWIVLFESAEWSRASSGGSSPVASAHAGAADSRDILGSGGQGSGLSSLSGSFARELAVTVLVPGAHVWEDSRLLRDASIGMDVNCERPFDVLGASIGHGLLLGRAADLDGGIGATASNDATFSLQDGAAIDLQVERVRAGIGSSGEQAGRVILDHPGGSEDWTLSPLEDSDRFIAGGPGRYSFTVDRTSASFDSFWLAAFGFDSALNLVPGLRDADVTDLSL